MALSAAAAGAFHQTKTIERVNLINGQDVVVDKRTVSLSVNVTKNLIYRQVISVSWTGAHPTGGIEANPNDAVNAQYQEYPMVLLECHGNPSSKAPAAQQIHAAGLLDLDASRSGSSARQPRTHAVPALAARSLRHGCRAAQPDRGVPNPVPRAAPFSGPSRTTG